MVFEAKHRVRVSSAYYFAGGATATVAIFPTFPPAPNRTRVDATTFSVRSGHSAWEETWVIFDQPQFEVDGDGPYTGAAIPCSALTRLD